MDYLSAIQALDLIKNQPMKYQTQESLRNLISQVDIHGEGDITLFYSGDYGDISAHSVVKAMEAQGDNIRIIDSTQVAQLIENEQFKNAVAKAFGFTGPREITAAFDDRSSDLNRFFYDAENGLWADASRRFAAETVGEVRTLTANACNDSLHT